MTTQAKIFDLSLDSRHQVIEWLSPCMPTCIALYRRIQFGHFTPGSRLLSSIDPDRLVHGTERHDSWIVAFVDRSCRPETEVWLAASWEHDTPAADESWLPRAQLLVRSVIQKIDEIGVTSQEEASVVNSIDTIVVQSSTKNESKGRSQYERHLDDEKIVLFGAVHSTTFNILKGMNLVDPNFVGSDLPYQKYIFDLSTSSVVARDLSNGFVHGKVDARDYSLVRSRTAIPRQDRTLRKLPSVAIYPAHTQSTAPIAWGFLGLDASLTTLHVEPEYRGLGLAKSLSLWLFLHDMETYWKHNPPHITSDRYAHADVATDNNSSQGVCKSLGGKWHFLVYWVRVDVGKA